MTPDHAGTSTRAWDIVTDLRFVLWKFVSFFYGLIASAIGAVLEEIIRHPDTPDVEIAMSKPSASFTQDLYKALDPHSTSEPPLMARGEHSREVRQQTNISSPVTPALRASEGVSMLEPSAPSSLSATSSASLPGDAVSTPSSPIAITTTTTTATATTSSENISTSTSTSTHSLPLPSSSEEDSKGLVLKNLPWTVKYDDLHEMLHAMPVQPRSVRYVRNEKGRFSGIVMVKYDTADEAQRMFPVFQDVQIGGRQVSVEFKQSARKHKRMKEERARSSHSEPTSPDHSTYPTPFSSAPVSPASTPGASPETSPKQQRRASAAPAPIQAMLAPLPLSAAAALTGMRTHTKPALLATPPASFSSSVQTQPSQRSSTGRQDYNVPFARPKSFSISVAPSYAQQAQQHSYETSHVRRRLSVSEEDRPLVAPSRQPVGPERGGKGFSEQYQQARARHVHGAS